MPELVYWGRKTYHTNPRIRATMWWPPKMFFALYFGEVNSIQEYRMSEWSIGRVAFEAYKETVEGITYDGKIIPDWDNPTDEVRQGWEAAGEAANQVKL